ncbi:MAG: hypothetical protein M5U28_36290 [Sandaracinaceae bacterium]|nr:hypothetical protein [Sandaracinaceae bacterium]
MPWLTKPSATPTLARTKKCGSTSPPPPPPPPPPLESVTQRSSRHTRPEPQSPSTRHVLPMPPPPPPELQPSMPGGHSASPHVSGGARPGKAGAGCVRDETIGTLTGELCVPANPSGLPSVANATM